MSPTNHTSTNRIQITQRITIIGAIIDFFLAIFKILVGYLSHSHALIADGIHSFSDLLSDALVIFVAKHAHSEPDEEHPYGHERFETLATLALAVVLLVTGGLVVIDGIQTLSTEQVALTQPVWLLLVIALSIVSKEGLYWWTRFYAKKIQSQLLLANAWHHRSDALSSIVVLIGVIASLLGYVYFDAIAAILVGLMIIYIAWKLAHPCLKELSDSAIEPNLLAQLKDELSQIDDVISIHAFRTRRNGRVIIIDVHIEVHPTLSVSEGHMVSLNVEKCLQNALKSPTDIVVHIDPEDDEYENLYGNLPSRSEIMTLLLDHLKQEQCSEYLQNIRLHYLKGKVMIDVYFSPSCASHQDNIKILQNKLNSIHQKIEFSSKIRLFFNSGD